MNVRRIGGNLKRLFYLNYGKRAELWYHGWAEQTARYMLIRCDLSDEQLSTLDSILDETIQTKPNGSCSQDYIESLAEVRAGTFRYLAQENDFWDYFSEHEQNEIFRRIIVPYLSPRDMRSDLFNLIDDYRYRNGNPSIRGLEEEYRNRRNHSTQENRGHHLARLGIGEAIYDTIRSPDSENLRISFAGYRLISLGVMYCDRLGLLLSDEQEDLLEEELAPMMSRMIRRNKFGVSDDFPPEYIEWTTSNSPGEGD